MIKPLLLLASLAFAFPGSQGLQAETASATFGLSLAPPKYLVEEALLSLPDFTLPEGGELLIHLPEGLPAEASHIDEFKVDSRSGVFAARIVDANNDSLSFRGQAIIVVNAMVPTRRMAVGEIIQHGDLMPTQIPANKIPSAIILDEGLLAGMEVRRMLLPGRAISESSISAPRVILRGDKVTISFDNGSISLTAPGKALEDGAKGAGIKVVNENSNKTITAIAIQEGLVVVQ